MLNRRAAPSVVNPNTFQIFFFRFSNCEQGSCPRRKMSCRKRDMLSVHLFGVLLYLLAWETWPGGLGPRPEALEACPQDGNHGLKAQAWRPAGLKALAWGPYPSLEALQPLTPTTHSNHPKTTQIRKFGNLDETW